MLKGLEFEQLSRKNNTDLTPEGEDVRLNGATGGSIVVEASNATVDLERGDVKQTAFEGVTDGLSECLSAASFLCGGHI